MTEASPDPDPTKEPLTLGGLVYSSAPCPLPAEQEWIRLVERVGRADQDALRELYERCHRIVFAFAARVTNSRETAEEIAAEVFHDVWQKAAAYEPAGGSVVGWIMNQARCRAIDRLRYEQRHKRTAGASGTPPAPAPAGSPHDGLDLRERHERLHAALARLTSDERSAIQTAFFGGTSYREAADRLDQPEGTIKTRIRTALAKLRRFLPEDLA